LYIPVSLELAALTTKTARTAATRRDYPHHNATIILKPLLQARQYLWQSVIVDGDREKGYSIKYSGKRSSSDCILRGLR
jgi:hypothetical protein